MTDTFTATAKTPLLGRLLAFGKDKNHAWIEHRAYVAVLLFVGKKPQASRPSVVAINHKTCSYALLRNIPQDKKSYGIAIYRTAPYEAAMFGYQRIAVLPVGVKTWADKFNFIGGKELVIEETDPIEGGA